MSSGAWLAASAAVACLLLAFPLRPRLPAPVLAGALGVSGAALAEGLMMIRPDPAPGEVALAVILAALLVPAHVRLVLGPFGPAPR